jgi:hypothetical protein
VYCRAAVFLCCLDSAELTGSAHLAASPPRSLVKLGRAQLKVLPGSGTLYLLV